MHICSRAIDWLTLSFLEGVGCALQNRLIKQYGSPEAILAADDTVDPILGSRTQTVIRDRNNQKQALERAKRELDVLERNHFFLLAQCCPLYPEELKNIADPPVLLYGAGEVACFKRPRVAIVGSRTATSYGKRQGEAFGRDLARQGVCVVSGGAHGIDASAHTGALAGGGETICVFGCGIDVVYPKNHGQLYAHIREKGALLSEFSLGSAPERFHFPMRNRIISGMSRGTVVVEASEKSGSLITARLALDQGREVFAVPGRVDSLKSQGCHRLIQAGAYLVQNAEDVLQELRLGFGGLGSESPAEPSHEEGTDSLLLSTRAQELLSYVEPYPLSIDALGRLSGFSARDIPGLLLELELAGAIRQLPGQIYERIDTA